MSVLVTGARGGIGAAVVAAFHARGDAVLAHDLRPADGTGSAGVDHVVGDLLDAAHREQLASRLRADPPRHVVAAHGIAPARPLADLDEEQLQAVMDVNFTSVVALFAIVQDALEEVGGTFTVVASQAGLRGERAMGAYCAAKFAVAGWAQALGRRAGCRVKVRVVCPGIVDTPLLMRAFDEVAVAEGVDRATVEHRRLADVPMGRLATPAEIADALVWLTELASAAPLVGVIAGGETFR